MNDELMLDRELFFEEVEPEDVPVPPEPEEVQGGGGQSDGGGVGRRDVLEESFEDEEDGEEETPFEWPEEFVVRIHEEELEMLTQAFADSDTQLYDRGFMGTKVSEYTVTEAFLAMIFVFLFLNFFVGLARRSF